MDQQGQTEQSSQNNGQPDPQATPLAANASAQGRSRLQNIVLGAIVGSLVGLSGIIGVMVFINRGQLPLMKAGEFEAAEARWNQRGPAGYDMDLEGNFDFKGRLHVEVRNGAVSAMTLDGQPEPPRLWDYYSVPGLFGIIRDDLKRNEASATNPENAVIQQAEFDAELGFPRRYQRSGASAGQGGDWRVVDFRAVK
jgi:hypothetical protein